MARSLKNNFVFNLLNTSLGVIFPLISFPYASRILLADGIGVINFYQSIIQYVILLTSLGIPMYAIREIAKVRDNVLERNKTLLEILILNLILTFLGYIIIFSLAFFIDKIQINLSVFLILSTSVLLTTLGCEWFYQGVEDFKYITIRSVIIRIFALVFLLVFVKDKSDIIQYSVFTILVSVGGNFFNFFRLRRYLGENITYWKGLKPFRHFLPAFRIFILNLIVSIYINLNSVMLGFMKNNESVGLFTAATKLTQVILTLVSSLGVVLLPRMSNMISNNQVSEFRELAQKSLNFIVLLTLPISFGLIFLSEYIIIIFCGATYTAAIPTLIIISPIILLIGVSNVLGIQILYPQGHERIVIFCTALGALINFILNLWLIPKYNQNGAAISTLIAELLVTLSMLWVGRKFLWIKWEKQYWIYIFGTLCMILTIYFLKLLHYNFMINLAISFLGGSFVYVLFLVLSKDPLYITTKNIIVKKIKN